MVLPSDMLVEMTRLCPAAWAGTADRIPGLAAITAVTVSNDPATRSHPVPAICDTMVRSLCLCRYGTYRPPAVWSAIHSDDDGRDRTHHRVDVCAPADQYGVSYVARV